MPVAVEIDNIVPISDFSRGKAAQVFGRVSARKPLVVVKRNKPTAVITSPEEYARLTEAEEDLALLVEALARLQANEGDANGAGDRGSTREQVMEHFGLVQSDLDAVEDVEFE